MQSTVVSKQQCLWSSSPNTTLSVAMRVIHIAREQQNTHEQYLQLNHQSDRSRNADLQNWSAAQTTLNEDTDMSICQLNPITYYILADVHLLNIDELNLHKRTARETLPSASSCSSPNRTRAAQLLIEAGTVLPAGHSLLQCKTPLLEKDSAVLTTQTGCYTTCVHKTRHAG